MTAIKLKKMSWQRRRFIASKALADIAQWMDEKESLKERILTDSTFQILGRKTLLEVDSGGMNSRVLVEVVGIPKTDLPSFDLEASEVLVWPLETSALKIDFETLNANARGIINGTAHPLFHVYHIVIEGTKLELHFFRQKDYIQSTH